MNCDNGSNVKKGLRSLSELAVTINEEPLVVQDGEDNWTNYASKQVRAETPATVQDNAPMISPPEDLFLPGGLEEPNWDCDFTEADTIKLIQTLEDQFVSLMANPRTTNMRRIACWCHTLQLPILKLINKKNNVFEKVRYLFDISPLYFNQFP